MLQATIRYLNTKGSDIAAMIQIIFLYGKCPLHEMKCTRDASCTITIKVSTVQCFRRQNCYVRKRVVD